MCMREVLFDSVYCSFIFSSSDVTKRWLCSKLFLQEMQSSLAVSTLYLFLPFSSLAEAVTATASCTWCDMCSCWTKAGKNYCFLVFIFSLRSDDGSHTARQRHLYMEATDGYFTCFQLWCCKPHCTPSSISLQVKSWCGLCFWGNSVLSVC